jgi:ribose-phosphate pyrophosphokinase
MKEQGAKDIYAGCTHALLSGNALEKIESSPIKELVITNTIAPKSELPDKIKILSVADVLGSAIQRIHGERSISEMFEDI